jgi:hypothetical protein
VLYDTLCLVVHSLTRKSLRRRSFAQHQQALDAGGGDAEAVDFPAVVVLP